MLSRTALVLGAGAGLLVPPPAAHAQAFTWALTNARIQTVTSGVIERGTIVIRNGLIVAVGAAVTVPADARVMDLSGRSVAPGIIDLASTVPARPGTTASAGRGAAGAGAGPATPDGQRPEGLDPAASAVDDLRLAADDLKAARDAGITAILVAPSRGAFRGQSVLMPTAEGAGAGQALRAPVAVHMGFQGVQGEYPATLLGVIAYERQTFYDARHYALLQDRYRANPRGLPRPAFDPGLEALVPVVRGELPVFFAASSENEIRRAVGMAREFDLDLTLVGATEGWRALEALTGRSVVVSVDYPRTSETTGWSYRLTTSIRTPDSAAAERAARPLIEGNAAALHRAGVRFALGTGRTRPAELLANVRKAVAAGLPEEAALAALTIRPAEIAGLGPALGSIEVGKIANLVVTENGDLLADSARVRAVFIDGTHYPVDPPAPRAAGGGGAPANLAGNWVLTVRSPQGPMEVTMTVQQSGTSFSGSMTSMMGTTPFSDGQIDGRSVTWSMTLQMGGNAVTIVYQGEVDGTRITGSAALGEFGTASFTGEKRP